MARIEGRPDDLQKQIRALDVLEGYPKKPSFVGSKCQALVNADPNFGVTNRIADVVTEDDVSYVELPVAVLKKHNGKDVDVDGERIKIDLKQKRLRLFARSGEVVLSDGTIIDDETGVESELSEEIEELIRQGKLYRERKAVNVNAKR